MLRAACSVAVWAVAAFGLAGPAAAASVTVTMHAITAEGVGPAIGTVTIADSPEGARFTTDVSGLPPGAHGFHVHENPNCGPGQRDGQKVAGLAAGGHWDPERSGRHEGPQGTGHLGDLPVLEVAADGTAKRTLVAPRLRDVSALRGRSLMIHAGGDNYADTPQPLGGGGARIACGVIQ
ncbi:Superoxide dismutase [Cu-Zn] [bacterium HR40]|nr:Superoxide dismutase [Cu-Zn] [bacterium HR40]